jgi:UDP-glucose 4-epimerase
MKVLLTGGAGYIGSHCAIAFVQAGHEVVLYDNLCNSKVSVLDRLEQILGQRPAFVRGDIRDTALLQNTLQQQGIEAVVHFAGLKAVGESVAKPVDYYANNVQGTVNLLQAMQGAGVKHLVFSSSATVYGVPQYLPYDEEHPTQATSPYGRSKLHIEEILRDVAASDPSWRFACLRYFNPVGAHESGLIGEDPKGIPNNLMPFIAKVATGQLPELGVFGGDYDTPDGTGVRDYIHVLDLADGHLKALEFLQGSAAEGWQAINLGSGHGYSVLQMLQAFEQASGQRIAYAIKPRRAGDIDCFYAKTDKAQQLLNWCVSRSQHSMCADTWNWQQNATKHGW